MKQALTSNAQNSKFEIHPIIISNLKCTLVVPGDWQPWALTGREGSRASALRVVQLQHHGDAAAVVPGGVR